MRIRSTHARVVHAGRRGARACTAREHTWPGRKRDMDSALACAHCPRDETSREHRGWALTVGGFGTAGAGERADDGRGGETSGRTHAIVTIRGAAKWSAFESAHGMHAVGVASAIAVR
eukprot:6173652-Pleurochrysis_carterae.AAC.12